MSSMGFLGLGTMGHPIAARLLGSGSRLVVWNRSASRCEPLAALGAAVASSAQDVVARCPVTFCMLSDAAALDEVLARRSPGFAPLVRDRTIVNLSTVSASDSLALSRDITAAGGRYVEAAISGSRRPAELGLLVAMVAGEEAVAASVRALLAPACRETVYCGPVPNGLLMKHATNLVLIPTMVALVEAAAFARTAGLPAEAFASTLLAGQMASDLLRAKLGKLVAQDWTPHSSVTNVLASAAATSATVREAGGCDALLERAREILAEARERGLGELDVMAIAVAGPD